MFITIVIAVLAAWLVVAVLLALVIGRAVKLADRNHRRQIAFKAAASQPARVPAIAS